MTTSINTLWTILVSNIPLRQWINIKELYIIVQTNYKYFTADDLAPVTDYNNEPTWHRNLRSALQNKERTGEILYDENANYRIDKPYVWRMIKEAVHNLEGQISYSQIKEYISNNWNDVNQETITAQIIVLSVNHNSRTHYPENQKARLTNENSPYDLLYNTRRGQVELYNPDQHGVWEIFKNENETFSIRLSNISASERVFTPTDIIWFKNVTNSTNGEAYLSIENNPFVIHFPNKHKTNVLSPAIGELILIYQKVNGVAAFTHLVTPIDNELIEDETRANFRYGRRVRFIAKKDRENYIPVATTLWKDINLSGITQGNACKLENVKGINNLDELVFDIWQHFQDSFTNSDRQSVITTSSIINEIETNNPNISVAEGELKLVSHLVRERNQKIIGKKKREAIRNGNLKCEVCSFSFIDTFNVEFIECHHITPISTTGVRETTLADLALVCANCHRMLHTKFDGQYLSIDDLRTKIE
ncbi:HNH endonuclease [Pedobacter glucosidilyticus]|uniref:HNH endonuclease n=1 Tax=Pedobacter glucosidilyticus TaxID=1122941 RepID=UPI0026EC7494|nr:HNH endonuclease [Pedobacter glucosidilyticus]